MSSPLGRVVRWLRPYRRQMAVATGLQAGTVASGIALMATSAWLISAAALHPSIAALQLSIVGVRFFGIARGALRYGERLATHDVTLRILEGLRTRIYRSLEPLGGAPPSHSSGDLLARFIGDVETLEGVYVRLLGPSLAAIVLSLLGAGVLVTFDPSLAVATLAGLCVAGGVVPWLASRLGRRAGGRVVAHRAHLQQQAVDSVQGVAELVAFNRAVPHASEVRRTWERLSVNQVRAAAVSGGGSALAGGVADLTALAALALALDVAGRGDMQPINLAVVTLLVLAAFEAVSPLPAAWGALGGIAAAAHRILALIDARPAIVPPATPIAAPAGRTLAVRHLAFSYPGSAAPVLRDISFDVSPCRPVALVGATGSGKSTLVSLLARFHAVPPGTLFLDDVDATALDPDDLRTRLAVGSQDTHLFAGTLRENLLLARPQATEGEIGDALRRARLDPVVAALPAGLETWIGEHGLQLSGGERQRVALARVFLKDAPIVVLDEPTAHLDPETERAILDELVALARTRAVLIVTHRLHRLEPMHEILVLQEGAIVERGRFRELLMKNGPFRRMVRAEQDRI